MVSISEKIGDRLSLFRKSKGLTQKEFSKKIECSQPNLVKIEKGVTGISSTIRAKLYAGFPELNQTWLDHGTGPMTTPLGITNELSQDTSMLSKDQASRFSSNLDKIETLMIEGHLPHDAVISVFRNLRRIITLQEDKIKDLEEDKAFLKEIVVTAKNTPFSS